MSLRLTRQAVLLVRAVITVVIAVSPVLAFPVGIVHAATVTANVFDDPIPGACATTGTGNCSLREAIAFANAHSGTSVILLAGTYALTIVPQSPSGAPESTILPLLAGMNITGAGHTATVIDGSTLPLHTNANLFTISDPQATTEYTVTMTGVTIRGGKGLTGTTIANSRTLILTDCAVLNGVGYYAGGIWNGGTGSTSSNGTLVIRDSIIQDNVTTGLLDGSGIANYQYGNVQISGSVITGNSGTAYGAGIYNDQEGIVSVTDSTISHNVAGFGGGIQNRGYFSITRSLIRDNFASGGGGGLDNADGYTVVTNSTISGNHAGDGGGGMESSGGLVRVTNVTIADNTDGAAVIFDGQIAFANSLLARNGQDCVYESPNEGFHGAFRSQDFNLASDTSCDTFTQHHDGTNVTHPMIGTLANNGGATETDALLPGSPAIDTGGTSANGCLATDQRGVSRPQGTACDIGAFEFAPIATAPAAHPTLAPASTMPSPVPSPHPGTTGVGMPGGGPTPHGSAAAQGTDSRNRMPTPVPQPGRH